MLLCQRWPYELLQAIKAMAKTSISLFRIGFQSVLSRKAVTIMLVCSIGLSTALLVGVQAVKSSAKVSFSHSLSGTDLLVGPRGGDIELMMYMVFHVGRPTALMDWSTIADIRQHPQIQWLVPISLGDSHRGHRVIGTTSDYFTHMRYGKKQSLSFHRGRAFNAPYEVVIGAAVAKKHNYRIGDSLYIAHGAPSRAQRIHKQQPFVVVGVLRPTATPVDQSVLVSLSSIEAIHDSSTSDQPKQWVPTAVTGCFVGLKSRLAVFSVQRQLKTAFSEPLSAIIPGIALSQLWQRLSIIDHAFLIITILVVCMALMGLIVAMVLSLNQRHQELAILRSLGCRPCQLVALLMIEAGVITIVGVGVGCLGVGIGGVLFGPWLTSQWGISVPVAHVYQSSLKLALWICLSGIGVSILPAYHAYRVGLAERLKR